MIGLSMLMCGWMGFGIQRPTNDGQLFYFFYVSPKSLQKQFISQILLIQHILLLHSFQSWLFNKLTSHKWTTKQTDK